MYIVREIFHLHFGRYKEAKKIMEQGRQNNLFNQPEGSRMLTDFTGEGYRLIFESPYATLSDFEMDLQKEVTAPGWQEWYEQFKPLVRFSEREILRQIE